MSVTILQQPADIAFSRNPVLYRLQTDALRAQTGAPFIGMLSPIAFAGPFSFTLAYNGLTLNFTGVDNPDSSGYQLQSSPVALPPAQYIAQLVAGLSANFYISRDFTISAAAAPSFAIQLTANGTGAAYNVSLQNGQNFSMQQQQAGVSDVFQPNFKLYTELWAENETHTAFTKVSDAFLEVDDQGFADIDLSDALTTVLLADGFDRPNIRFGVAAADLKSCRKYYLNYAEAYGDTQVVRQVQKAPVKTALLGGISKEKLEEFDFPGYFVQNNLLGFLKQEPLSVKIRPEQQEFLSLVTFNRAFASLQLLFTIYFTDGSSQTATGDSFASAAQYEKFTWPVGFEQNHFQLLNGQKIVEKYDVLVVDETNTAVSETKTYYLDYTYQPYTRFFLFLSSFGSYDTKKTYGKNSNQYEIVSSSASRTLQGSFSLIEGEQLEYAINLNNTETYTSGYLPMRDKRSFRDLFLSLDKILVRKGRAYPMVFASKTVNEFKDGDNLHALTFEMGFRFKETLWTYDDKDDIPVGLYLNLPAGSGVPTMPAPPFPVNYFDGRYYLKTETYNRAEIDAKLASLLATIAQNQTSANSSISQLSLTLTNAISNFNTNLSQYFTQSEIIALLQQISIGSTSGTAGQSTFISLDVEAFPANAPEPFIIPWDADKVAKFGDEPGYVTFNTVENNELIKVPFFVNRTTSPLQVEFHFQPGNAAGYIYLIGTGKTGQPLAFDGTAYTLVWSPDMVAKYGPEPAFKTFNVLYGNTAFIYPEIKIDRSVFPYQILFDFGPDPRQGQIYILGNTGIQKVNSTIKIAYNDTRWNADHTTFTEGSWAGTQPVIWLNRVRDLTAAEDGLAYLPAGGFSVSAGTINDGQTLTIFF